jgi:hypothetical protein
VDVMLFERKFKARTRGLVCGVPTLAAREVVHQPIIQKRGKLTLGDAKPLFTEWSPWTSHWKVVIRAREGGELIWHRPFATIAEAQFCYQSLIGIDTRRPMYVPPTWLDGETEILIATVKTFNSTNTDNTKDWDNNGNLCPLGVRSVDYLCIAGGASGGARLAGGGGAGGLLAATGAIVAQGTSYTITVGSGGAAVTSAPPTGYAGINGGASQFGALANPTGGGGAAAYLGYAGSSGGSGGGGTFNSVSGYAGVGGQGSAGGNGNGNTGGAGGGGAGGAGASPGASVGGTGGVGVTSSISGGSVGYAGGGGGCGQGPSGNGGTASDGGGAGASADDNATNATANKGGGGGGTRGVVDVAPTTSGAGGSGVIILSYVVGPVLIGNMPMLGM